MDLLSSTWREQERANRSLLAPRALLVTVSLFSPLLLLLLSSLCRRRFAGIIDANSSNRLPFGEREVEEEKQEKLRLFRRTYRDHILRLNSPSFR